MLVRKRERPPFSFFRYNAKNDVYMICNCTYVDPCLYVEKSAKYPWLCSLMNPFLIIMLYVSMHVCILKRNTLREMCRMSMPLLAYQAVSPTITLYVCISGRKREYTLSLSLDITPRIIYTYIYTHTCVYDLYLKKHASRILQNVHPFARSYIFLVIPAPHVWKYLYINPFLFSVSVIYSKSPLCIQSPQARKCLYSRFVFQPPHSLLQVLVV